MLGRLRTARAEGNADHYNRVRADLVWFTSQVYKGQGWLELKDQETALGMVKAAHALPQMGELGADALQTEMAAAKAFRGAVKDTTGALETAHTVIQTTDRAAMVIGLATGVGGLAQAGRAILMQGGKAALARWAAREGAKLAAGLAADQSGVLEEVEAHTLNAMGLTPEDRQLAAAVFQVARESSRALRKKWESKHKRPWPKDPATGRNQDVSHKKALADGGDNSVENVEPKPHSEHMDEHRRRGDFRRWGARSQTPEDPR